MFNSIREINEHLYTIYRNFPRIEVQTSSVAISKEFVYFEVRLSSPGVIDFEVENLHWSRLSEDLRIQMIMLAGFDGYLIDMINEDINHRLNKTIS